MGCRGDRELCNENHEAEAMWHKYIIEGMLANLCKLQNVIGYEKNVSL